MPSVDTWSSPTTPVRRRTCRGGIGFYEAGQPQPEQSVVGEGDQHLRRPLSRSTASSTTTSTTATSTSARVRRSPRRTARRRQPARTITIIPDVDFGQDLSRRPRELQQRAAPRRSTTSISSCRTRGRSEPADDQPGRPLRAGEARRAADRRLLAEEQLGAAHRRHLRRDRRRQDEAVRQLRPLLRAQCRTTSRRAPCRPTTAQPRRLLRRRPDAADSEWDGDAVRATAARSPIISFSLASAPTRSIRTRSCRTSDEFVVGFEREVMPNTTLGVRYIYRSIPRVLEDVANCPMAACETRLPISAAASNTS